MTGKRNAFHLTIKLANIVYITILVIINTERGRNLVLFAKHRLMKFNISPVIINM